MRTSYLLPMLLLAAQLCYADTTTIAFGGCLRQWDAVPILDTISTLKPDAFIFTGDNVYTDTGLYRFKSEPGRIAKAYRQLAGIAEYQRLKDSTRLFATWDDHDYGRNNAGAEYRWKDESKRQFMSFFDIANDAPMKNRPGIYAVHYLGDGGSRIQLLLLDTRSFRAPLQQAEPNDQCPRSRLVATHDDTTTILGEDQWLWLAAQLEQPAALRLIVSSIQVIPDGHCYEKWGNFPHERERLIRLIREADARQTIIISGDRHLGEISTLPGTEDASPLYEITASGLNSAGAGEGEINPYRLGDDNVRVDHFGTVRLVQRASPYVELSLYGNDGAAIQQYEIDYASWELRSGLQGSE